MWPGYSYNIAGPQGGQVRVIILPGYNVAWLQL